MVEQVCYVLEHGDCILSNWVVSPLLATYPFHLGQLMPSWFSLRK